MPGSSKGSRYYSPEFIERVAESTDFLSLVSEYTRVQKRGSKYVALCPFHTEKTPSFNIDIDKGVYYCFGCGKGGNIFTFIIEKEGFNFPEAIEYLANKAGIELPKEHRSDKQSNKIEDINNLALEYFVSHLHKSEGKRGMEYLLSRGLKKEDIVELSIGYAPDKPSEFYNLALKKGYTEKDINSAGLISIKPNGIFDRFRNRIIFPIFSTSGRVSAFGGRIFPPDTDSVKYINSPETSLYKKGNIFYGLNFSRGEIRKAKFVYLVEGYMDFISLWKSEIKNVVATSGTALTETQAGIIKRYTDTVIICYDGDSAGKDATIRAIPILLSKGLNVKIFRLPNEEDPDSFIYKKGRKEFLTLSSQSPDWLTYLLSLITSKTDLTKPNVKILVAKRLKKFILSIEADSVKKIYTRDLAHYLGLTIEEVESILEGTGEKNPRTNSRNGAKVASLPPKQQNELNFFVRIALDCDFLEKGICEIIRSGKEWFFYYPGLVDEILLKIENEETITRSFIFSLFQDEQCKAYLAGKIIKENEIPPVEICVEVIRKVNMNEKIIKLWSELFSAEKLGETEKANLLNSKINELMERF